jgi:acetyl-CoA carboxylase carboxyltransferase component
MSEIEVRAPFAGIVVVVSASTGRSARQGETLLLVESMKMEHEVVAPVAASVVRVDVSAGDSIAAGDVLVVLAEMADVGSAAAAAIAVGPDAATAADSAESVRPELAEWRERVRLTSDEGRPDVVARRHADGRRTARENIADLCDPGSFEEYGSLVVAAQRARRSEADLIERTPADGLVAGIGRVDGRPVAVLSYDYTVLAGTQGQMNHQKKDRLFELVARLSLPVVLFAEGGGGRPGDTDMAVVTGLNTDAFALFARLSGQVPLVGIVSGRCFAGNAALLGCCDVIVATPEANVGMGGPAMIEGGGLGVFAPSDIGPVSVQTANGVIDVLVDDEAAAVEVARRYVGYFADAGAADGVEPASWSCADQMLLREVVPPDRRRAYDVRRAVELVADTDSLLELRPTFAPGMVTAIGRVEGRPIGIIANNPIHLAGAIDANNADKAARFMQLCQAHRLPILFLCDTPGFMVGPDAEETALVRHVSRMFVTGAALTVPFCTVILRKGYGLGAQAMAGGSFRRPIVTVAWPTGELGGMGLEGAVRLGFRRELDAIPEGPERDAAFDAMVERAYAHGKALNVATHFEIDDVIDPAHTRQRILHAFASSYDDAGSLGRRPFIDTW